MKRRFEKKISIVVTLICLMLVLVPMPVYGAEIVQTDETTILEESIYISNAEELVELAENCIDDNWSIGKTIILKNDIDMARIEFSGIPTFGGIFLGQGYTISGLNLKQDGSVVGLFRYTQSAAVIDRVNVEGNIQPGGTAKTVGAIAGSNGGTIKNCTFNGTVSGTEQIGGIAGINKAASVIENCTVSGTIHGNHYIGGIAGVNKGVVRQCTNEAKVNTEVEHNSLAMSLDMVDSFGNKESIDSATNIGGIAGTSNGVIRECYNKENVGYKKMGYNVGGIAGSHNGYLVDCMNYAKIEGSDGVGGIVGQFRPNMVLKFGADPVKTMTGQMNSMMSSVKDLTNSIGEIEFRLGDGSFDMNAELNEMKNSLETLGKLDLQGNSGSQNTLGNIGNLGNLGSLGNLDISGLTGSLGQQGSSEQQENSGEDSDLLTSVMNNFSNSFGNIYKEGEEIRKNTENAIADVTDKMNSMVNQMEGMIGTVSSIGSNTGLEINDVSRDDTAEDIIGKAYNCINYGEVAGETAVGGIAGMLNNEIIMSEEDVEVKGEASSNAKGTIRLVVRDCKNHGKVSASKDYVGGIAGNMALGAIIESKNIGNMDALNADYVGGIAGCCETVIMNCYSKSILAGANYVGGIAGHGVEVYDSYAFTDIAACTEYGGEILGNAEELPGSEEEVIQNNFYYFVGKDYGGIDGINYLNATGRISLSEFLALENLDEMFKTINIRFKAEGQEDVVLTASVGGNISRDNVPKLTMEEGQMYDWRMVQPITTKALGMNEEEEIFYLTEKRLKTILFDQIYEADYEAKNMVSQSSEKTEDNRSVILAVGSFEKDTSVELTNMLPQESMIMGETILQNWQVSISDSGVKKLHYRIPEGMDGEDLKLLVKDSSGNWIERESIVEGSYLVFEFTDSESGFALAEKERFKINTEIFDGIDFKIVIAAVAAVIVLLFMILYIKKNYTIVKKG